MALEVKRKRVDVDLILDQEKAEQVAALGADLERAMAQHVTEGGNAAAKRIAEQIDRLRDEVKDDTVRITLEALPLSPVASGTRGEHRHRERRTETTHRGHLRRRRQTHGQEDRAGNPRGRAGQRHDRTVRRPDQPHLVRDP